VKVINKKTLGTICLGLGTFLNPFGFDILVYELMKLMNGYWNTMLVLYCSSALSFGLSLICFKFNKSIIGNTMVTIAFFLNPFGYDFVVYLLTLITGDYWMAIKIMYLMAIVFFSLFIYFYEINPMILTMNRVKSLNQFIKNKFNKNGQNV
jgi:hypothetical protein